MTEASLDQSTTLDDLSPLRAAFPARGGIVGAIGPLSGRNKVAAAFYDGPGWRRFRPCELAFLALQGGQKRARMPILRHLPDLRSARILEVGIGDGDNLPWLPTTWEIHGVDIARTRLEACLRRFPKMAGRLAWAEGEALPYRDATFDACLSVGGFNYYGDHAAALGEMRRVTRPGGTIVVADEATWLQRCGIGHILGVPKVDAAWFGLLGLDRDFAAMVIEQRLDLDKLIGTTSPGAERTSIWHGLGYCIVGHC
jgi:SAM-dependent methyltransferase